MDGGDGCTVTYLMPLSCTLKNDYSVKLYVHFTTIKKTPTKQNCSGHSGSGQVEAGAFALWFSRPETCALLPFVLSWVVMASRPLLQSPGVSFFVFLSSTCGLTAFTAKGAGTLI